MSNSTSTAWLLLKRQAGRLTARLRQRSHRVSDAGFTLIEILVVLAIIGLIMGLVGPRVLSSFGQAKAKTARLQIDGFRQALDVFYLDLGRYPTAREGLGALILRPEGAEAWNGPYVKGNETPKDPWGRPYVYRVPGRDDPYEIVSTGPDGHDNPVALTAAAE